MLKYKVINADENIDRKLSFHLKRNKDTEKALIYGIANLKNFNSKTGTSFETLTYLAVNYYLEYINVHYKKDESDELKKHDYKKNNPITIKSIKATLDTCNHTQYIPIKTIQNEEYVELFNAKCYTECYLIIQTAYFFGSERFGNHQFINVVEHYRNTGNILQNDLPEERLESAFKRINDFKQWVENPAKFKKKPFEFNKDTYLNNWYYGTLDILANTFGNCKNYMYEFPLKNDGTISEYRIYNKFIQTSRILREVQPFEMFEFDVKSGHLSYIDLHVGSNVAKTAYENYAKEKGCTRDEAKRKFQTILNLRDRRNSYKSKEEYIKTLCGFGWTVEQAKKILTEVTDSEYYLFGHWASKREEECVSEFAETNNLIGWTRGHDAVYGLRKRDVDYKSFCTSFQNDIIQFELKEIGLQQDKCTVLQKQLETKKSNSIIPTCSFLDNLNKIRNEINTFERIEAELLTGYLSDKIPDLKTFYSPKHINLLVSPASSGKTSMVAKLKDEGYKCLLVVPTQAIIKNKQLYGFVQVFGETCIQDQINSTASTICTFDKASQIKPEDYNNYDYILIDESHLLFTEYYRIQIIALFLKNLKYHINNVRNELSPIQNCPTVVMMTGTPTGEEFYFEGCEKNGPIIQKKEYINNKKREVTLVGCEDVDSCYTSFINKVKQLLKSGHRVLIPTNMGEKWINCVVSAVDNPKFGVYSNNQKNGSLSKDINSSSKIGEDTILIFTTSLGNVGIDINNIDKATTTVVYTDNRNQITGQTTEQYACRFRKIDVEVFLYFVVPKEINYNKNFVFNYLEDPNDIELVKNDIAKSLFEDEECSKMKSDEEVDPEKIRWKHLNQKLHVHFTNIICVGGYLKSMGYNVQCIIGDKADIIIIENYKALFNNEKELEYECKIRTLDFILSDIEKLTQNFKILTIKSGTNSLVDNILTLENEQLFRSIRTMVKKCRNISSGSIDTEWIRTLMISENLNESRITNKLKFMEFVNRSNADKLDYNFIEEVDKFINMNSKNGILTKSQFRTLINNLAPTYINTGYNNRDNITKEKLKQNLIKKLKICYVITFSKVVKIKPRFTKIWVNETIVWFESLHCKIETKAPVNQMVARNQRIEDIALAKSKPTPSTVGKAYEHITNDVIDKIKEKIKMDGFINVDTLMQLTGLTKSSVGQFVTYKFSDLKSKPKMIRGVRETRYYP